MDEDDDKDEFADEFPESVDTTPPEDVYDDVFVGMTADATSILFEECRGKFTRAQIKFLFEENRPQRLCSKIK